MPLLLRLNRLFSDWGALPRRAGEGFKTNYGKFAFIALLFVVFTLLPFFYPGFVASGVFLFLVNKAYFLGTKTTTNSYDPSTIW